MASCRRAARYLLWNEELVRESGCLGIYNRLAASCMHTSILLAFRKQTCPYAQTCRDLSPGRRARRWHAHPGSFRRRRGRSIGRVSSGGTFLWSGGARDGENSRGERFGASWIVSRRKRNGQRDCDCCLRFCPRFHRRRNFLLLVVTNFRTKFVALLPVPEPHRRSAPRLLRGRSLSPPRTRSQLVPAQGRRSPARRACLRFFIVCGRVYGLGHASVHSHHGVSHQLRHPMGIHRPAAASPLRNEARPHGDGGFREPVRDGVGLLWGVRRRAGIGHLRRSGGLGSGGVENLSRLLLDG